VKFLRNGVPPWPEADEDARAADSPGRGHAISPEAARLSDALDHAAADLRTAQRESLRQQIVQALVRGQIRPRFSGASTSWRESIRRRWRR